MNEEKVTRGATETWRWTNWGEEHADCVSVSATDGLWNHKINHESKIPNHWPEKVRTRIRSEILAHRPEGEDEVRSTIGGIWRLRWHNGERQVLRLGYEVEWETSRGFGCEKAKARAEAWFAKNRPAPEWQEVAGAPGYAVKKTVPGCSIRGPGKNDEMHVIPSRVSDLTSRLFTFPEPVIAAVCLLFGINRADVLREDETMDHGGVYKLEIEGKAIIKDGILYNRYWLETHTHITWVPRALAYLNKHGVKLAGNQISLEDGAVLNLRWHNGKAQAEGSAAKGMASRPWFDWMFVCEGKQRAGDAWFRANCPIDRFITDSGNVLEFRMRDDGEAQVFSGGFCGLTTVATGPHADSCEHVKALYRFRDSERAKWTFETGDAPGSVVGVRYEGKFMGTYAPNGGHSWPSWVRTRAEQMWRERQPKPKKLVLTARGFEWVRGIKQPDSLRLTDPHVNESEADGIFSWPRGRLRITIEPIK